MKYPCGVIRDILPLYKDEVCSEESRGAVEEHLSECDECSEYYKELSDDRENIVIPEIEDHKADSLRAVKRRINRGVRVAVIIASVLLVICIILIGAMVTMRDMSERRTIEYNGSNITVSMKSEGLIATVRGTWYSGARIKTVHMEADGEVRLLKIFRLEDTEWDAFKTGKNKTYDLTIAYADMEADMVDAVYYYSGELNDDIFKGMGELPPEELAELLGKMTLLWEKSK
ncbi:MAG: zf-HC2 domain-containing protein [Oscillospiraceae bacterium]|nr:zf-HC2 domain-containing protein [Oscillospiraceae bacterium]